MTNRAPAPAPRDARHVLAAFAPEAREYFEDVDAAEIARFRAERSVKVSGDEWELIDGFGTYDRD